MKISIQGKVRLENVKIIGMSQNESCETQVPGNAIFLFVSMYFLKKIISSVIYLKERDPEKGRFSPGSLPKWSQWLGLG